MTNGNPAEDDDNLIDELRQAARRIPNEPAPADLTEVVRTLPFVRNLDADLVLLTYDSLLDATATDRRGGSDTRQVSFGGGNLTVNLEIVGIGTTRRVIGQVVPPQELLIGVLSRSQTREVRTDEVGAFIVEEIPAGVMTLRWIDSETDREGRTQGLTI